MKLKMTTDSGNWLVEYDFDDELTDHILAILNGLTDTIIQTKTKERENCLNN